MNPECNIFKENYLKKRNTNNKKEIVKGFANVINRYSLENGSNTPDFILGEYLFDCLQLFDKAYYKRQTWYSKWG